MKWLKKLNEILKLKSLLLTAAVIIVFVTTYALVLLAITMERKTYCGMEEHTNSDDCYTVTSTLICGQEESEGHTHTDACYETEKELTCGMGEHTHTDECYVDPDAPEETETDETQQAEETGKAADTTEASEEQEMTEAAAETESDEETEEETETAAEEIAYPAVVLEQQILEAEPDENGQPVSWIDVEIDAPEGALPEGTTFVLEQYIPEEKYQTEFDEELDNTVKGGILEHKSVSIRFFDAAGEPVVPAADVQVFIRDGLIRDAENVELVKIDDSYPDDLRTELVKLDPKANEKTDEDVITYTLTPEDPAVLSVVSTTLAKTLKAEGDDYTITVGCSAKAGIPEGSTLQVKEIVQDTSDYQGLVSDAEIMVIRIISRQPVERAVFFILQAKEVQAVQFRFTSRMVLVLSPNLQFIL